MIKLALTAALTAQVLLPIAAAPAVALETKTWLVSMDQSAPFAPFSQLKKALEISNPAKQVSAGVFALQASNDEVEKLKGSQSVVAVELEGVFKIQGSNDPLLGDQWHFNDPQTSPGSLGGSAYLDSATGRNVVVAVIDTGYASHPDLAPNVLPGYDFVSLTSISNDGDGWDSDPSDPGDWVSQADANGALSGCDVSDSSWHGTHVMGIIGAAANNGIGISGVAPESKLLPIRVIGKCGARESDMIAGLTWATGGQLPGVPVNPNPASVVNMSLGSKKICSVAMQEAVNGAIARGAVVVAAAGNSSEDLTQYSPAGCSGVIAVTALGSSGALASYSNFGMKSDGWVVAAPGGDRDRKILSSANAGATSPTQPNYVSYAGTSMAAPMVAGLAAALKQVDPALTGRSLAAGVMALTTSFRNSACQAPRCGAGQVSTATLVDKGAAVAPNVNVQLDSGRVSIRWDANRAALASYTMEFQSRVKGEQAWSPLGQAGFQTGRFSADLPLGKTLEIQYAISNPQKRSAWKMIPNALVVGAPVQSPQELAVTALHREIVGKWAYPDVEGGQSNLKGFIFTAVSLRTGAEFSCSTREYSCKIIGLTNGASYRTAVTAVGISGSRKTLEGANIAPVTFPSNPTAAVVIPGKSQALVVWGKPVSDGGARVDSYIAKVISRNSLELNCSSTSDLFCLVDLSEKAPYSVTVRALNSAGQSPASRTIELESLSQATLGSLRYTKQSAGKSESKFAISFEPLAVLKNFAFEARVVGQSSASNWQRFNPKNGAIVILKSGKPVKLEVRLIGKNFQSQPQVTLVK